MTRNYGDPDEGYEIDIDELLERDRRRQALFTREERELKKRVLALVRTKPDRFADAGKRIEAKACSYIHIDDPETLLSKCGAMGLSSCLGDYCEQDIDALPRLEWLRLAEELVLIHWIATDADAAEVEPPPTVIAAVPWNEASSTGRMFLRDQIFAPYVHDHDNSIDLVPSPFRERWGQLVQDALEVLGAPSGFAPDVARAEPELQKLEREATTRTQEKPPNAVGSNGTWITVNGVLHNFRSHQQAQVVRLLADERERAGGRDGAGLREKRIGELIDSRSNTFRLRDVFKGHPTWTKLIRSAGKGVWALYLES